MDTLNEETFSGDMAGEGAGFAPAPSVLKRPVLKMKAKKALKKKPAMDPNDFPGFKRYTVKEGVELELDQVAPGDLIEYPLDDVVVDTEETLAPEEPKVEELIPTAPISTSPNPETMMSMLCIIKDIKQKISDLEYEIQMGLARK